MTVAASASLLAVAALESFAMARAVHHSATNAQAAHVRASIISSVTDIVPGKSFDIALVFDIDDSWHMYWKNPGDSGMPPSIAWTLPPGFLASEMRFPVPIIYTHKNGTDYIHEKQLVVLVTIQVPQDFKATDDAAEQELLGRATWLVCDANVCLPEEQTVRLKLPVRMTTTEPNASQFAAWRNSIPESDEAALKQAKKKAD